LKGVAGGEVFGFGAPGCLGVGFKIPRGSPDVLAPVLVSGLPPCAEIDADGYCQPPQPTLI